MKREDGASLHRLPLKITEEKNHLEHLGGEILRFSQENPALNRNTSQPLATIDRNVEGEQNSIPVHLVVGKGSKQENKNAKIAEPDNQLKDKRSEIQSTEKKNSYYYPGGSILMNLGLPLTESEEGLISEFHKDLSSVPVENDKCCEGNSPISNALRCILNITKKYLKKGIILNGGKHVITDLVFRKIADIASHERVPNVLTSDEENAKTVHNIVDNLLLRGGKVEYNLFYDSKLPRVVLKFSAEASLECKKIHEELKSLAREGVINGNTQGEVLNTEIDNTYFYVRYSQDSIIDVSKIVDNPRIKEDLDLRCHIFHIGRSIVEVDNTGEKKNYTNVERGSIKMSFNTEVGQISIYLSPDENSNKIKVEIDEKNRAKFNELKDQTNLGKNSLLGGKSVLQAIKDGSFERSASIKSTETITQLNDAKTVSTSMERIYVNPQQKERKIR